MNYSKQREALLNILRATDSHPTANDIYLKMRETDPKIALGTVYRNLSLLTEKGLVKRIDTKQDSVHYDGCTSQHYHFVCNKCGRVSDLDLEQLDLNESVEKSCGGNVSSHTLVFYGICKDCRTDK